MGKGFAAVPQVERYRIANARVPACLLDSGGNARQSDDPVAVDLIIDGGRIDAVVLVEQGIVGAELPSIDLDHGMVWPCFADVHTHLDKGHIWPRRPNPDGTFMGALNAVMADRAANWSSQDVAARMEFALACAYAHGTSAIRTHIDSRPGQTLVSWPVLGEVRGRWAGRVRLEASPLYGIDMALDDAHMGEITEVVGRYGSTLGAVTYMCPQLQDGLDRLFRLASDRGWGLDFHVDETMDPTAVSLRMIAETALRFRFRGPILAGHCCSLSRQEAGEADRTMDLVAEAGVSVVSLPMCNMYLQDRTGGRTPRYRGVTLLHELKARGVNVMIASDNTRDPFYAYGDLDALEVYREATRIAHFDHPVADWPAAITKTPAAHMGAAGGVIRAGGPADLVLFRARTWTELLSRPQSDRTVLRAGKAIDTDLPDYRVLDGVVGSA